MKHLIKHLHYLLLALATNATALSYEPIEFKSASGQVVAAQLGRLEVPAHHDDPASGGTIELQFVRFKATTDSPGAPIIYLAGGPGGPGIGTAKRARFPLFMALRKYADVIAFDQRGTGLSQPPPSCQADQAFPVSEPLTRDAYLSYALNAAAKCVSWWREQGVDLAAYNTWESAGDLEALRLALGAEKLTLWGISYGTHLAMAAVKRMGDDRIDRLILASAEGLDQTVKLPSRWDAYLGRLADQMTVAAETTTSYPDLASTLRAVLKQMQAEPVAVEIRPQGSEQAVEVKLGSIALQYLLSGMGKNPQTAVYIPGLVYAMAAGEFRPLAEWIYPHIYARPARFSAMSLAMDMASGISPARLELVTKQAETALIGDTLNFPMPHFVGALDIPVLSDTFRAPLTSELPALILTGTLDGRTFPEAHAEVLAQFANGHQVIIENAGHDLFMASPDVTDAIEAFMRGETPVDTIRIPPPHFTMPEQHTQD